MLSLSGRLAAEYDRNNYNVIPLETEEEYVIRLFNKEFGRELTKSEITMIHTATSADNWDERVRARDLLDAQGLMDKYFVLADKYYTHKK